MNTYDIENYIRTDPVLRRKTIHVITSDTPITGDACVVNTLKSGDHGIGHWFVVATVDGRTELFDSQARLSSVIPHHIYIHKRATSVCVCVCLSVCLSRLLEIS